MKLRVFGCRKFGRLISERDDRDLTEREEKFLAHHRDACPECRASERASCSALDMLRAASIEPEIAPTFDDRILRRLKVQTVTESLNYWSPAMIGAGIACIALFVALHLAALPNQENRTQTSVGQASRFVSPATKPNLDLSEIPDFSK